MLRNVTTELRKSHAEEDYRDYLDYYTPGSSEPLPVFDLDMYRPW